MATTSEYIAPDTTSTAAKAAYAWLVKLYAQLNSRNVKLAKYDRYYRGDHPLLFATSMFREVFGSLFKEFADNWTELVVDAVEERLNVEGFRFKKDQARQRKAWRYWQDNNLDADSQLAHTEALINGMAYGLVWPTDVAKASPIITVEDPQEMIVCHAPGARRLRDAALKVWIDYDAGKTYATVYLPDAIWKFEASLSTQVNMLRLQTSGVPASSMRQLEARVKWVPRIVKDEAWPLEHEFGVVPVVPLYNKPRLRDGGVSEIRNVIPMQDATNKLLADMIVASEFAAFKQRWATGIEIPNDPDTQKPMTPTFQHAVNRLWTSPDASTKFGEFAASDLGNYTNAIELIVQHVASQTRTPPHYFYLSGQFPSGESIKAAETGLVAKAHRRQRHFGEGWEEIVRLAFLADGDPKGASASELETIWSDPESRSESEHIDALLKMKALGVPLPALWERAGFSPTEIESFTEMQKLQAQLGVVDPGNPNPADPANRPPVLAQ